MTSNLIVSINGAEPVQYVLEADSIEIGRGPENRIHLNHPSISSAHLALRKDSSGAYELTDLNSSNGVRVNGRKVEHAVLSDGDRLLIGGEVAAWILELPEDADAEDYMTGPVNHDQKKDRQFLDLAERKFALKKSLKNHRKRAESLNAEIKQLGTERHRRQELCRTLAEIAGKTLQKIRDNKSETKPRTTVRPTRPAKSRMRVSAGP